MYPSRFRYEAAHSLDEAIDLLRSNGEEAKVLAGGQSLVPLMKLRFASPDLLVDLNTIPGLDYHHLDSDGNLHIGALCRHADLERSALLNSKQPTMAAAAPLIADPIVRSRGTLVGSLLPLGIKAMQIGLKHRGLLFALISSAALGWAMLRVRLQDFLPPIISFTTLPVMNATFAGRSARRRRSATGSSAPSPASCS